MPASAAASAVPAAAAIGAWLGRPRRCCFAPRTAASADSSSSADAMISQSGATTPRQQQQAQAGQQPRRQWRAAPQRRSWPRTQSAAPAAAEPTGRLDLRSLGLEQLVQLACGDDALEPRRALAVLHALSWELKQRRMRSAAPPLPDQALPRLFDALQRGCEELQVRDLVLLLQLCTRLRARPPQALLEAAARQLCHRLPAEAPSQLVTAVWMLTRLGHQAGARSLLEAIDARVQRQLAEQAQQQQQQQQHGHQQAAQQQQQQPQPQPPPPQQQQHDLQALLPAGGGAAPPAWLAQLPPLLLVHLLWACGKAGYRSAPLLCGITAALLHSAEAAQPDKGSAPAPLAGLDGKLLGMLWYSLGLLQWSPSPEFAKHAAAQARAALPAFTSQGLSNTAWALARLAPLPAADGLAAALAAAAAPRLAEFSDQELGMLLVALSQRDGPASWRPAAAPRLYKAASQEVAARAPRLGERDVCSMLSALVTAGHRPCDAALAAVAARAEALLPDRLAPASLAWLLWSYAHLRAAPPRSLLRRAEAALRGPQLLALYEVGGPDVARLCWALAELRYYSGALLADLSAVLRSMWERLPAQSMALALRSFALQNFTPHELLDVAAEHLASHLDDSYDPHSVALSMWAFGRLGVHPGRGLPSGGLCTPEGVPLMEAVAAYALRHVGLPDGSAAPAPAAGSTSRGAFTLQGLSMLLWAFATLEHHPGTTLLQATGRRFVAAMPDQQGGAAGGGGGGGGPPCPRDAACLRSVSQAAWAFAKFGHADEAFFLALAKQADCLPLTESPPEEVPHSLTSLAYAAAKLRVAAAPALLRRLLPLAQQHIEGFASEEACQLLWALAHAGGMGGAAHAHEALLDAAAAALARDLARGGPGVDPRLLCMAVHALAELQYRCDDALLDSCVRAVAAAGADVPVSLLAKLLWGCAHVGHAPEADALESITADLYHRLSHKRGNRTVLQVPDLVLLLWALAALGQYTTQLYRNVAYRATRLPEGVPEAPRLRRLLREATVLHSCEHRLDPVAAEAAAAILPAWMAGQGAAAAQAVEQAAPAAQQQQQQQEAEPPRLLKPTVLPPQAPLPARDGSGVPPAQRRAEAEAVCAALQAAGLRASLKQLSYGDYIVTVERPSGGSSSDDSSSDEGRGAGRRRRAPRLAFAAVPASPATGRAAYNRPSCLLGSALVAQRVLAARELPAVPATGSEAEVVERSKAALRGDGAD